jgi:uncharacterized membrane protein YfbV (UPF0208 family)
VNNFIIFQKIKEGIEFLDSWELEVENGVISSDNFLTKETAEGLRVTLHSTIAIIEFLLSVNDFSFVLTAKLCQDKLEVSRPAA